jgi:hypothetical protein
MTKYPLPRVDLIAADCIRPEEALRALRHSMKCFEFARVILFSSVDWALDDVEVVRIAPLNSLDDYSRFMLKVGNNVNNDFVLNIQEDGFIINPGNWTDEYLEHDYIGAPWPTEESWMGRQPQQIQPCIRDVFKQNRIGNGGFSLRSRRFLNFASQFDSCGIIGEDSFLCIEQYDAAMKAGIRFAPFELAAVFAYENPCIEFGTHWYDKVVMDVNQHFGFHGNKFHNWQELLNMKR